jgi:hypothetical protein
MVTDLGGTLSTPLQLEFCSSGITDGTSEGNNRSDRTDHRNSPLFTHHMVTTLGSDSSSDNFVTGESVLYEYMMQRSYLLDHSHIYSYFSRMAIHTKHVNMI